MSLSEFEIKRCEKKLESFLERKRPAPAVRSGVDIGYSIEKQSVEIFEIRPQWDDPTQKITIPLAKATYVKSRGIWKVYWRRADMKWHRYEPARTVKFFEGFLDLVEEDAHSCFFG